MKIWCGTCSGTGYVDDLSYYTRIGIKKPCIVCKGKGYVEYDATLQEFMSFYRIAKVMSINELENKLKVYDALQDAFDSGYAVTDEYGLGYNLSNEKELLGWFDKIEKGEMK